VGGQEQVGEGRRLRQADTAVRQLEDRRRLGGEVRSGHRQAGAPSAEARRLFLPPRDELDPRSVRAEEAVLSVHWARAVVGFNALGSSHTVHLHQVASGNAVAWTDVSAVLSVLFQWGL